MKYFFKIGGVAMKIYEKRGFKSHTAITIKKKKKGWEIYQELELKNYLIN